MYKVVVVEDEEIARKGIIFTINWDALNCMIAGEAANGEEGAEVIRRLSPDIIVTDLKMPRMDGVEMIAKLREQGNRAKFIILTAYDWSDIEVEARAAGVTAFCSKPMFMSDIRETLMAAIGQKQAGAEDNILPAADSDFRGRRILLVEDNELNSEIAVELLNAYGFVVDTAENGAEAVEKVKNSTPGNYDLVLMDVQMPVMNGYEATKQIRALNDPALAGITILAMTANAFNEDRKKALECGMNGFLSKPIVIEELIGTLQKNIEQVSLQNI